RDLGEGSTLDYAGSALGLLALVRGRYEEAVSRLWELARLDVQREFCDAVTPPFHTADLVEARAGAGLAAGAAEALARFAAEAERSGRPLARAVAQRLAGLLGPPEELDDRFGTALALHRAERSPFEEARTRLLYGERLRRAGRRADARVE